VDDELATAHAQLTAIVLEAHAMLGEGLTTAAPVQQMKFDEAGFDRPRHPRRRRVTWLLALGASLLFAIAIIV
jgi:hypothetical protein